MNNISINQALDVWGDLWQAYYGKHHYGGDEAEIYAYRLMLYLPSLEGLNPVAIIRAQNALYQLVEKFAAENNCEITIDGLSPRDWVEQSIFDHRCHVKILQHVAQS